MLPTYTVAVTPGTVAVFVTVGMLIKVSQKVVAAALLARKALSTLSLLQTALLSAQACPKSFDGSSPEASLFLPGGGSRCWTRGEAGSSRRAREP